MRVTVIAKANEDMGKGMAAPTPEMLEAFAAMDRFTEELVQAGVFIAAAGLQNSAHAGVSPLGYLQSIRLERARQSLERGASPAATPE